MANIEVRPYGIFLESKDVYINIVDRELEKEKYGNRISCNHLTHTGQFSVSYKYSFTFSKKEDVFQFLLTYDGLIYG